MFINNLFSYSLSFLYLNHFMHIVFYRIQELKKYYKIILQNYNITIILQNSLYIYIFYFN